MNLAERVKSLVTWGQAIGALTDELESPDASPDSPARYMLVQAKIQNPWFTQENVISALKGIVFQLREENLRKWISSYSIPEGSVRKVGVIMAGNIPAAGFQDTLCVLISGNHLVMKCASDDKVILPFLLDILVSIEPAFKTQFTIAERLNDVDAVVATGSNNSARYFEYYFSKYPHIIRKNRNSVAVLNGNETEDQLLDLGKATFTYFGMGCRSVSHLFVPKRYKFDNFFRVQQSFGDLMQHSRYMNNFDYHNALYLLNKEQFLTNNFLILRESDVLSTPVSVLHYTQYNSINDVDAFCEEHAAEIQCRFGEGGLPFAEAQTPAPWNYPDNVDVLKFLLSI